MNLIKVKATGALKGVRLDKALSQILQGIPRLAGERWLLGLSRSQLTRAVAFGAVKLNRKALDKSYVIKGNELLEVDLEVLQEILRAPIARKFSSEDIRFEFRVVYEDRWLLIGNKPAGVLVHPTPSTREPTLVDYLQVKGFPLANTQEPLKPGVVHRLDRGTSGLVIIAKDVGTHRELQKLFQARAVKKFYLALTLGGEISEIGEIVTHLQRKRTRRELFRVSQAGKGAVTRFALIRSSPLANFLLVRIVTGRTHQIRVHLASRGQFVLNDMDYGKAINAELRFFLKGRADKTYRRAWSEALPPENRKKLWAIVESLNGFFLHAYRLSFVHPRTGHELSVKAEPPDYFMEVLNLLGLGFDEQLINSLEGKLA